MSAAVMPMSMAVRIMPPVIAVVVTIIAATSIIAALYKGKIEVQTDLRPGRPGIEKGYSGKQGLAEQQRPARKRLPFCRAVHASFPFRAGIQLQRQIRPKSLNNIPCRRLLCNTS
ncbi:MAG: hypothetical protein ACREC0_02225 [Methylocella sp.]